MLSCFIRREDLVYRLEYESFVGCATPVSSAWLSLLLQDLDEAGDSVPKLSDAFCEAARLLKADDDEEFMTQMSWELARIVVPAKLLYQSGETWYIELTDDYNVLRPELGSAGFPYSLLGDYDTSQFCRGLSLELFFLPTELEAEKLFLATKTVANKDRRNVKTWDPSDSLVHWVIEFAESQGASARPMIRRIGIGDDIQWSFYLPSKDKSRDYFTPKENILRFITQQAEVSTSQLLYINYCGRRRTFDILRELQKEDRIENRGHGRYAVIVNIPSEITG